jgi:hypothetical protein
MVIGFILMSLLILSIVCGSKSNMVGAWSCIGSVIVIIALIPTIAGLLEPYHPIDKLAKLITGYNETDEERCI